MQSQKSPAQLSLSSILQNYLPELLPQATFVSRSQQTKRNISDFIDRCLHNKALVQEMVDRGVKSNTFETQYERNLALFSVEMLGGEYGDSYKMFIGDQEESRAIRKSRSVRNQAEIEEEIEAQPIPAEELFKEKYSNFAYLLEYIRRPLAEISEINMSYFTKIITNIISNKAEEVYAYFDTDAKNRINSNYHAQGQGQGEKNETQMVNQNGEGHENEKSDLQVLIALSYRFGGLSEVLGKIVAQEGAANKYLQVKKIIIKSMLQLLKLQSHLKSSPNHYQFVLDFVSYILSRTKYRSDDPTEQICKVAQRFVDQSTIWYFKERAVKAVIESNGLLCGGMNSSGYLNRSESSKSAKKEELKQENQEELGRLENVFQNSVAYLGIIVERINAEQEVDKYESETEKPAEPAMDFQVDEALFQQNSLYELFTLTVPSTYTNLNKMHYYELLLKLTRNSRYKKASTENHMGLLPSFLTPILIHLLKMFRRESKKNGLVNFYIGELICQSILPKITAFDTKQAMMVLSALNPSEEVLGRWNDTRAFTEKMLIIMKKKCQWFDEHFAKLGLNLKQVQENFKVKLAGNCHALQNRKNAIKEFQFLFQDQKQDNSNKNTRFDKSDRLEDENDSSSDSEKDLKEFNPRRNFQYPLEQNGSQKQTPKQNNQSQLEQNLFRNSDNQIKQQIHVSNSEILQQTEQKEQKEQKEESRPRKESQIELLVDSAGEQQEKQKVQPEGKPQC